MYIKADRVDRQLQPIGDRARVIASLAAGIDSVLQNNSFWYHLTAQETFPAIAALYGTVRRLTIECTEDTSEQVKADAQRTLDLMNQIIELTAGPDPNPPSVQDVLESLGIVPTTTEEVETGNNAEPSGDYSAWEPNPGTGTADPRPVTQPVGAYEGQIE